MKIQLKRSNVLEGGAAKEPTAAQMEYGELAVNYNDSDPAIFIKDSTDSIIRIGGVGNISDDGQVEVPSGSNPPATPGDGNLWYNPEDGRLYVYYNDGNSSQWVDASPDGWNAAEDGASIHVGDTPPASPLEGSLWWNTTDNTLYIYYIDATSEQWVTASPSGSIDVDDFVAVSGDNMTGDLTLGTDKITLDATDGNATFASNVTLTGDNNAFQVGDFGIGANSAGGILIRRRILAGNAAATGNEMVIYNSKETEAAFKIQCAPDDLTTKEDKVVLNNDGSATFAGDVIGYNRFLSVDPAGGDRYVYEVYTGGTTGANRRLGIDNNGTIRLGGSSVDTNPNISLNADGSAEFTGKLWAKGDGSTGRVFEAGVSGQAIINNDGSASFAGTVTATVVPPSDARFKENIEPAKPQLADVVALGGLLKNYDWNDQAPLNEELRSVRQLGLIAQEAAEVCPSIVKDIYRTKTVEVTPAVKGPKGAVIKEAVTKEEDDSYKGISQDALIMKLIGAVAELSAEVEALKAAN